MQLTSGKEIFLAKINSRNGHIGTATISSIKKGIVHLKGSTYTVDAKTLQVIVPNSTQSVIGRAFESEEDFEKQQQLWTQIKTLLEKNVLPPYNLNTYSLESLVSIFGGNQDEKEA